MKHYTFQTSEQEEIKQSIGELVQKYGLIQVLNSLAEYLPDDDFISSPL